MKQAKKKTGRPTDYNDDVADAICERLADGESLRTICADGSMPNRVTVYRWLFKHAEFSNQYARAREMQAETMADEMQNIADDATAENVQVARLRIDTRKWAASKLLPKKYGDKIQNEVSGAVSLNFTSDDEKML